MQLNHAFEVPASRDTAWALLTDIPRVVPCMPGAELVETVSDTRWKGRMAVRLGPIALAFDVDVEAEELDVTAGLVRLRTTARESRGRGGAQATIASTLEPAGAATRVLVVTDLALSGPVAQYAGGVIDDVADQMIGEFTACLRAQLAAPAAESTAPTPAPARPVGGLRLMARVLLARLRRLLGRQRR